MKHYHPGACGHDATQLVALVENDVTEAEREQIETHVKNCDLCRIELEQIRQLAQTMGKQEAVAPPPELRERFNQMLWEQMKRGTVSHAGDWWHHWVEVLAHPVMKGAVFATVAIGLFFLGTRVEQMRSEGTSNRFSENVERTVSVQALEEVKLDYLASAFGLSRPSERLHAIKTAATGVDPTANFVIAKRDLLMKYLKSDPNPSVRLMALNELGVFDSDSTVQNGILDALERETEPLNQIHILKSVDPIYSPRLKEILGNMLSDGNTDDLVKSYAFEVLLQIDAGNTSKPTNNNII